MRQKVVRWSVSLVFLLYLLWFLLNHRDVFSERFAGTFWHAALLAAGILATWVVNSLQTLLPLRELGAKVGFRENLLLTVAVVFGNYLPMRAGSLMRMEYIRSVHGVGYLRYTGILGARSLMLLWAAGGAGLAVAAAMAAAGQEVHREVFLTFSVVLAAGILPFLIPLQKLLPSRGIVHRAGVQMTEAIELVRRNRRMTVYYLGLVTLQLALLSARLAVAFDAIQRHPPLWVYGLLSPVATILSFINVTPGNLGLREWVVGLLLAGTGADYADGIFAATVDRAVLVVMTFAAGGLAAPVVISRLGRRADVPSA